MIFNPSEFSRYSRHLSLPQFGIKAQEKLKKSKVLVVGTGGLGTPILQYLTAAGVGKIGLVDFDSVDESNLQRQVLFGTSDIGKPKTTTAIKKLRDQNPNVQFIEHFVTLDSSNALGIMKDYDVVVDGTDNFPTRYLVNDACVLLDKPYVYASIYQFEGQVSVFNYNNGPNYRDLFPTPPPPGLVPNCAEGGVLGVLPGIIGSIQASEVVKIVAGIGEPLSGRLFLLDVLNFTTRNLYVRKNPDNPVSGVNASITQLIDYESFCGLSPDPDQNIQVVTVEELKKLEEEEADFTLIDVRETYEYEIGNLNGVLIPLGKILNHLDMIPRSGNVIIHCRSGVRSKNAIELLGQRAGYTNLKNLKGGILAWKERFDPDMNIV